MWDAPLSVIADPSDDLIAVMNADLVAYLIAVVAGVAAGFINTLAGSGSFLTLPALVWLGLPTQVANATNRVGILIAAIVALRAFPKDFGLPRGDLTKLFIPCSIGAAIGAIIAARMDPRTMDQAVGVLMLLMLAVILWKRGKTAPPPGPVGPRGSSSFWIFLGIGAYGGFIQAGVGIFLLAGLVSNIRLPLRRANAVKLLLVLVFTVPAFLIFLYEGQIRWGLGLLMAAGQALGAWIAARFAGSNPNADAWIQRLLVIVLIATSIRLLWP